MRKAVWLITLLTFGTVLGFAQSSGSFSAMVLTPQCEILSSGSLQGGLASNTVLSTTVQTPNSSSTALVIRPSLVTGLYTDTKLTSGSSNSSTATAGVRVYVKMDGKPVAPDLGNGVVFDERFQQLSSNLLNQITQCAATFGSTNLQACYVDLLQSTLSAHSFDFVAPNVGGGNHTLTVSWSIIDAPTNGGGTTAACVGPGVLTVEQVKNFSQNGGIVIQ